MNIVFDLGGVVFNWRPDKLVESLFQDTHVQALIREEVFEHPDWIELDRGTLSCQQAVNRAAARTGLPAKDIERTLRSVPLSLTPIEKTIELVRNLRDTRHRLYVLSNMQPESIGYLKSNYDIWDMFDGIVISSQVQMVKPEPQIFRHLIELYQLEPAETVFIDDMQENIAAAAATGIHTIRFLDPAQCKRDLANLLHPQTEITSRH